MFSGFFTISTKQILLLLQNLVNLSEEYRACIKSTCAILGKRLLNVQTNLSVLRFLRLYRARAAITKQLTEDHGFSIVAIGGD